MKKSESLGKTPPTSETKEDYPNAPTAKTPTAGLTTIGTTTDAPLASLEQRIKNLEYAITKVLTYLEKTTTQPPILKDPSGINPSPEVSKEAQELINMQTQTNQPGSIPSAAIAQNLPYLVMGIGNAIGQSMMGNIMGTGIDQQMKQLMAANYLESMNLGLDIVKAVRNKLAGGVIADLTKDIGITPTETPKVADTKPTT